MHTAIVFVLNKFKVLKEMQYVFVNLNSLLFSKDNFLHKLDCVDLITPVG